MRLMKKIIEDFLISFLREVQKFLTATPSPQLSPAQTENFVLSKIIISTRV